MKSDAFGLPHKKALVFLDAQWYCRQCYPGATNLDDAKDYGCTIPATTANALPPTGDHKKLGIVCAIQLAALKGTGLNVTSMRGMGDDVEDSCCLKEVLDVKSPVNNAVCESDCIKASVAPDCRFLVTVHPARMYRQFSRVCSYLLIYSS